MKKQKQLGVWYVCREMSPLPLPLLIFFYFWYCHWLVSTKMFKIVITLYKLPYFIILFCGNLDIALYCSETKVELEIHLRNVFLKKVTLHILYFHIQVNIPNILVYSTRSLEYCLRFQKMIFI